MMQTVLLAATAGHEQGFTLHYQLLVGSTVLVVLLLILLAALARPQIGVVPTGLGAAFEHVFDWLDGMARDMIGPQGRTYVPFLMSIFLFVLFSNWSGLIPWPVFMAHPAAHHSTVAEVPGVEEGHGPASTEVVVEEDAHAGEPVSFEAPSASYNTTLALALISFFAFNFFGLKKNIFPPKTEHHHHHGDDDHHHHEPKGGLAGVGTWIAHFWQPTPMLWNSMEGSMKLIVIPLAVLFICLNIIEEFARILSLSIRLFGNIFGEHQVKLNLLATLQAFLMSAFNALTSAQVFGVLGWTALAGLIWVASAFAVCLGALAGFIQAMIFAVLSLVYIAHAVADEH